jgi:hypothetical protein
MYFKNVMVNRSIIRIYLRIFTLALITAGLAAADFIATYDAAGVQTPNPATLCAGPTTCILGGEQYAYLNFFDKTGFFDKVVLTQAGGFESENDTVGYLYPVKPSGTTIPSRTPEPSFHAPEPTFFVVTGVGLLCLAVFARRRKP